MEINIQDIYSKFRALEQTEALTLGGSRASGRNDAKSDYDIYVYVKADIEESVRQEMLSRFCDVMEIGMRITLS